MGLFGSKINGKTLQMRSRSFYRRGQKGRVLVAMVTLDYQGTAFELTSSKDGDNMEDLVKKCGGTVYRLKDKQCTRDGLENLIAKVGAKCAEGDTFMFFFAGHGSQKKEEHRNEEDGLDECLVLVDRKGQASEKTFFTDQDLAHLICSHVDKKVKVITFMDCCHSGTICDPKDPCWESREVLFMSGCVDRETSGDTGYGGIFTNSVLLALDTASRRETDKELSAATLRSRVLLIEDEHFSMYKQHICIDAIGCDLESWPWPLVPKTKYEAPLRYMFKERLVEEW